MRALYKAVLNFGVTGVTTVALHTDELKVELLPESFIGRQLHFFLARGDFCCLLITLANCLDLDQDKTNRILV